MLNVTSMTPFFEQQRQRCVRRSQPEPRADAMKCQTHFFDISHTNCERKQTNESGFQEAIVFHRTGCVGQIIIYLIKCSSVELCRKNENFNSSNQHGVFAFTKPFCETFFFVFFFSVFFRMDQ